VHRGDKTKLQSGLKCNLVPSSSRPLVLTSFRSLVPSSSRSHESDFYPHFDSKREIIWVGGGAGMAPLRAQIMHMTKTLHTTDREMHYFYGARALNEVFYLDDFLGLEKEYPNFHFHLALDRPDPAADAAGVKYTPGFVHQVMYNTYLKDHEAPEDVEYYMCGPGPMSNAVVQMLDSLGVEPESIMYDNFGG